MAQSLSICQCPASHDRIGGKGLVLEDGCRTIPTPRPRLSRRGWRTSASARRCTSRATRGRRHPPHYCSSLRRRPTPRPERSSRLSRPRHRVARKGVAHSKLPCRRPSRSLRLSGSAQAGRCYATVAVAASSTRSRPPGDGQIVRSAQPARPPRHRQLARPCFPSGRRGTATNRPRDAPAASRSIRRSGAGVGLAILIARARRVVTRAPARPSKDPCSRS